MCVKSYIYKSYDILFFCIFAIFKLGQLAANLFTNWCYFVGFLSFCRHYSAFVYYFITVPLKSAAHTVFKTIKLNKKAKDKVKLVFFRRE